MKIHKQFKIINLRVFWNKKTVRPEGKARKQGRVQGIGPWLYQLQHETVDDAGVFFVLIKFIFDPASAM